MGLDPMWITHKAVSRPVYYRKIQIHSQSMTLEPLTADVTNTDYHIYSSTCQGVGYVRQKASSEFSKLMC